MAINRFQPPSVKDLAAKTAFSEISQVIDGISPLANYPVVIDQFVQVSAGQVKRLHPQAVGQQVVIPAASSQNFNSTVLLLVENSQGTLRIRAASGTIKGATDYQVPAGTSTTIYLVSNGEGVWLDPTFRVGDDIVLSAVDIVSITAPSITLAATNDVLITATDDITLSSEDIILTATDNLDATAQDITLTSTAVSTIAGADVTITATDDVTITATDQFNVIAADAIITASATMNIIGLGSGGIILRHDGADAVNIESDDATGGFLVIEAGATSTETVGSTEGMYWVQNLAPSIAMFTDGNDNDWRMDMNNVDVLGSIQTVTNATTTLTCVSGTVQANSLKVGSTYKLEGFLVYSRGATATAQNTVVELSFDGAVYASATITNPTVNGTTGACHFTAFFTCLSTGTTGTFISNVQVVNDFALIDATSLATVASTVRRLLDRSVNVAAQSIVGSRDTTVDNTLTITARMSAAVANTTLTITNGLMIRVR